MNIVLDQSVEHVNPSTKKEIGMVVVRGNSIAMMECLDKVRPAILPVSPPLAPRCHERDGPSSQPHVPQSQINTDP